MTKKKYFDFGVFLNVEKKIGDGNIQKSVKTNFNEYKICHRIPYIINFSLSGWEPGQMEGGGTPPPPRFLPDFS